MATKHTIIYGDSRNMSLVPNESVQLVVTSPPYWQLKDYGVDKQIGFDDSYEDYINNLNLVWRECFRTLEPGCRLCINIGDQFARSAYYGRYKAHGGLKTVERFGKSAHHVAEVTDRADGSLEHEALVCHLAQSVASGHSGIPHLGEYVVKTVGFHCQTFQDTTVLALDVYSKFYCFCHCLFLFQSVTFLGCLKACIKLVLAHFLTLFFLLFIPRERQNVMRLEIAFCIGLDGKERQHPCAFPLVALRITLGFRPSLPCLVKLKRGTSFKVFSAHPDAPQCHTQQFLDAYFFSAWLVVFFSSPPISS